MRIEGLLARVLANLSKFLIDALSASERNLKIFICTMNFDVFVNEVLIII